MSIIDNIESIQLLSNSASLKILLQGSGTMIMPATAGGTVGTVVATIPHGYASDNLLWQVGIIGGDGDAFFTPFSPNAGGVFFYSSLDSTNLYIEGVRAPAVDQPAFDFPYTYRILIP